jgi:hypothetical protein
MIELDLFYLKVKITSDDSYELIAAEHVGEQNYRLVENPICASVLNYGTVVTAIVNATGGLEVTGVSSASNFRTRQFIRSALLKGKELEEKIGRPVAATGGHLEMAPCGRAYAHIPKDSSFDLDALFAQNNYHPLEIPAA